MNKSEYNKRYHEKHKDEIKEKQKQYYQKNKDAIKEKSKKYYQTHKEQKKDYQKDYYKNNKEKIADYKKEYYTINKSDIQKYKKQYSSTHREYLNDYFRNYQRKRRNNDNLHKFKMQIRHLIWLSFNKKGKIKSDKTENILGCNLDYFISYLLNSFEQRYGYKYNYDEPVHIDHIVPLSKAESENEIIKLCNYKNLQLLKANDNLCKSDKNNDDFFSRNFGGVE